MDDWLDRYAGALGVPALGEEERRMLLELAREVAHGTERRFAPLSSFLVGVAAGGARGAERASVIAEAMATAERLVQDHLSSAAPEREPGDGAGPDGRGG